MLEPAREKGKEEKGRKERKKESHARTRTDARKVLMTALPHYARDSHAQAFFFSPPPILSNRGGRARKTIELLRRPRSTKIILSFPRTIPSPDEKNRGNGDLCTLETRRDLRRSSYRDLKFERADSFLFNPEIKFFQSNCRSAMIDQRHRKIHRGPSTPPPRRIPAS